MEIRKEFTNELGNTIVVTTENKDIDGVEGIYFSIAGPTSETTEHITRHEALILFEQLSAIFARENL